MVADINKEKAETVAASLCNAIAVGVDVTNEEQVEAMMEKTVERYGKLDLLVSNAAIHSLAGYGVSGRQVEKNDGCQPHRLFS